MARIQKYYHRLVSKTRRKLFRSSDFRAVKQRLLLSGALTGGERDLLARASLRVHFRDDMYETNNARHYLSVGLSAIDCIESVLEAAKKKEVRTILDFPCGYGRVLRFLRAKFPAANITAGEINARALFFCRREFSVRTIQSGKEFGELTLPERFDLIWCGSLVTHLDEKPIVDLLRFFSGHLLPGGLLIFTTHGAGTVELLEKNADRSMADAYRSLLSRFRETGFGYVDYKKQRGYGGSLVTRERMLAIARSAGLSNNIFYHEKGWNDYQDVFGFLKPAEEPLASDRGTFLSPAA